MSRPLSLALTAATICTLALPLRGSQAPIFRDGQSFYIVAVRASVDTSLFRVCQAGASEKSQRDFPGLELRPGGEDRSIDETIKGRIEAEFKQQNRFRVATSLDRADYVFFAEATFIPPMAVGGGGQLNAMTSIVAIVVPAGTYASSAGDAAALLENRLWEGAHLAANAQVASPEDVVRQLHGKSARGEGAPVRAGDATRNRAQVGELSEREPATGFRLNGRPICGIPQPQRAPAMSPETEPVLNPLGERAPGVATPPGTSPNRQVATFQTRVVVIAVPVVASNQQGAFVRGLTASDFRVFEDAAPQRIDRMTAESEPFTAALVMDTSYSMLPRLAEVKAAASAFIDALRPDDRALAVTFDSRTWLACDVTHDKDALRRAIVRLQPFGALTRVHDALDLVTEERLEKIAGRKAMIVLTDGMDVGSQLAGATGVMARLEAANIPVYAVQFGPSQSRRTAQRRQQPPGKPLTTPERSFDRIISFDHATQYLEELARNTGGLFQPAAAADAIVQAFRRAADDLRSQYVLYYYPSNQALDGTFRRIRVEVRRPGVTIRARAGYRAPGVSRH